MIFIYPLIQNRNLRITLVVVNLIRIGDNIAQTILIGGNICMVGQVVRSSLARQNNFCCHCIRPVLAYRLWQLIDGKHLLSVH